MERTRSQSRQYKEWKKLNTKKYRNRTQRFLIEGVKMIDEAITWGGKIESILYSKKLFEVNGGENLYRKVLEKGLYLIELDHHLLKGICNTQNPQGIVGIIEQMDYSLEDIIKNDVGTIILLNELQDPGNLGTIVRTADAAGVDGVVLSKGCVDLYNDKVLRATMGSIFHLPIIYNVEMEECILRLKREGYQVIGTGLNTDLYYQDIEYLPRKALVIGNEAHGLSNEMIHLCTDIVKIPIVGHAESLNAAIAAGILMYKLQGL